MAVPLLVISGSLGSGKTTVLTEASDLLAEAGIAHAAIDLDHLAVMHPPQGEYSDSLMFANLAAVWPIYTAAGAKRLLLARVVDDWSALERYREAVSGAASVVCLLTAPTEVMQDRLNTREPVCSSGRRSPAQRS